MVNNATSALGRAANLASTMLPAASSNTSLSSVKVAPGGSEVLNEEYRKAGMALNLRLESTLRLAFYFQSKDATGSPGNPDSPRLTQWEEQLTSAEQKQGHALKPGPPGMYKIVGSEKYVAMLRKRMGDPTFEATGDLSPVHDMTMPEAKREPAGIPQAAAFFAYAYRTNVKKLAQRLKDVNLFDEPWAFFLVLGGLVFFDTDGSFLSVAAITPTLTRNYLQFDGPFEVADGACAELHSAGRMVRVGWPALRAVGLHAFSWVHSGEKFHGGRPLVGNHHGALVYERTSGEAPLLFVVALHTHTQIQQFRALTDEKYFLSVERCLTGAAFAELTRDCL